MFRGVIHDPKRHPKRWHKKLHYKPDDANVTASGWHKSARRRASARAGDETSTLYKMTIARRRAWTRAGARRRTLQAEQSSILRLDPYLDPCSDAIRVLRGAVIRCVFPDSRRAP